MLSLQALLFILSATAVFSADVDSGRALSDANAKDTDIAAVYDTSKAFKGLCPIINEFYVLCHISVATATVTVDNTSFVEPNPELTVTTPLTAIGQHKIKSKYTLTTCAGGNSLVLLKICLPMTKGSAVLPSVPATGTWHDSTGSLTVYGYDSTSNKLQVNTEVLNPAADSACTSLNAATDYCATYSTGTQQFATTPGWVVFYTPSGGSPKTFGGFISVANTAHSNPEQIIDIGKCVQEIQTNAKRY